MKTMRAISLVLMLTLAIGPALASACTIACALPMKELTDAHLTQAHSAQEHSDSMHAELHEHGGTQTEAMGMPHCQQAILDADMPSQHLSQSQQADQQHPQDQHNHGNQQSAKPCDMSGCHSAQSAATVSADPIFLVDVFTSTLPRSNIFGASADLTPPIKPPA